MAIFAGHISDTCLSFQDLRALYVQPLLVKIQGLEVDIAPVQDLVREVQMMDHHLNELSRWPLVVPPQGHCSIMEQIGRAMKEARNIVEQHINFITNSGLLLREPFNDRMNIVVAQLHLLTTALAQALSNEVTDEECSSNLDRCPPKVSNLYRARSEMFIDYSTMYVTKSPHNLLMTLAGHTTANNPYLAHAAVGNWLELQEMLSESPMNVNDYGPAFSPLHMAVLWQDAFAVAMLLGFGANVNARTKEECIVPAESTALHIAADLGNVPILKLLIAWNADRTIPDKLGRTCCQLQTAMKPCRAALMGAEQLYTSAQEACKLAQQGEWKKLQNLIRQRDIPLNIKAKPSQPFFLIHQVAYFGDQDTYQLLLDAGAHPLLRTSEGLLPSSVARSRGFGTLAKQMAEQEESGQPSSSPSRGWFRSVMHGNFSHSPRSNSGSRRGSGGSSVSPPSQNSSFSTRPRKGSGQRSSFRRHLSDHLARPFSPPLSPPSSPPHRSSMFAAIHRAFSHTHSQA